MKRGTLQVRWHVNVQQLRPASRIVVLSADDIRRWLTMEACISAVEEGFRLLGLGQADPPVTAGIHVPGGGFHIKAGVLDLGRKYCAVKTNGNFPDNPRQHGLPTIQGVLLLCDGAKGSPLAIMDSAEITARRTGAATAVAARRLAPPGPAVVAVVGCGTQAPFQVEALRAVLRVEKLIAVDGDPVRARAFARALSGDADFECVSGTLSDAAQAEPDIWVTCTTSHEFLLFPEHVREGAFVAGVGVDNGHKRELAPGLLACAHVVADHVEQCARIGDLHHAVAAHMTPRSVRELSGMVARDEAGRLDERSIHVFDSTGIGIQDVAAGVAAFEAALLAEREGRRLTTIALA